MTNTATTTATHAKDIAAERGIATELRTMDQLSAGDVVHVDGLRVVLVETPRMVTVNLGIQALTARGRIANPEYLQTDQGRYSFGGIIALDGSDGWTIQGVSYVQQLVEVAA